MVVGRSSFSKYELSSGFYLIVISDAKENSR